MMAFTDMDMKKLRRMANPLEGHPDNEFYQRLEERLRAAEEGIYATGVEKDEALARWRIAIGKESP